MDKAEGSTSDWWQDRAIRVAIRLALSLPLRARLRLMGTLVRRVISPFAGWQERAMANLEHIWPDMPEAERRRIGLEMAHGMRIEGRDDAGPALGPCPIDRLLCDRLVAEMEAVEIAQRDHRAAQALGQFVAVIEEPHAALSPTRS